MILDTVQFESNRLITGILQRENAAVLFEYYSDEKAMSHRGSSPHRSLNDSVRMIDEQSEITGNSQKKRLGIWNKLSNELIGTLLLKQDDITENIIEVGFSFGKTHWNKGYATETIEMIEKGLKELLPSTILKAWCVKQNIASVRLFEQANYKRTHQNEHINSVLFLKQL